MVTSGNGSALGGILWPPAAPADRPSGRRRPDEGFKKNIWAGNRQTAEENKAALRGLLQRNANSSFVYSSEGFCTLPLVALAGLSEIFSENGLQIKAIYYVRHLMDMAWSSYNQALKGRVASMTFGRFLSRYKCNYKRVIETFSSVIGENNIIIRLYEQEKENLITGFFNTILEQEGIGSGNLLISGNSQKAVNRSLTRDEMEVMLFVNKLLHQSHGPKAKAIAKKITERILRSPGDQEATKIVVSADEMRIIEENNREVLEFVNDFVRGEFELKLKSDKIEIGERAEHKEEEGEEEHGAVYRTVIASLIQQMNVSERENGVKAPRMARRLRQRASEDATESERPTGTAAVVTG